MAFSTIELAIGAMALMDKDEPYGLKPEDVKRRLAEEVARLCREAGVAPLVIGGLAVNHHGYARFTADVHLLVSKADAMPLVRRFKQEGGWRANPLYRARRRPSLRRPTFVRWPSAPFPYRNSRS